MCGEAGESIRLEFALPHCAVTGLVEDIDTKLALSMMRQLPTKVGVSVEGHTRIAAIVVSMSP